ncbi:MAG: hypothetical protein K1X29_06010 [Bdellovibrionales bacterium]|nr:hypothetical protein [Bdellovibrionales bacterium]
MGRVLTLFFFFHHFSQGFLNHVFADNASQKIASPKVVVELQDLGGVKSEYSEPLKKILLKWIHQPEVEKPSPTKGSNAIEITCWSHAKDSLYIGVEQRMVIQAPLAEVSAILQDFNNYKKLFEDFADVHEVSREGKKIITYWEQKIPIPFVPNIKYNMIYFIQEISPDSTYFLYQLLKSGKITFSDGFIFLKKITENKVLYIEYDFFNAQWGSAKIFGVKKLWQDAVKSLALSDLAIKVKAENKDLDSKNVLKKSKSLLNNKQMEECFANKKEFPI